MSLRLQYKTDLHSRDSAYHIMKGKCPPRKSTRQPNSTGLYHVETGSAVSGRAFLRRDLIRDTMQMLANVSWKSCRRKRPKCNLTREGNDWFPLRIGSGLPLTGVYLESTRPSRHICGGHPKNIRSTGLHFREGRKVSWWKIILRPYSARQTSAVGSRLSIQ